MCWTVFNKTKFKSFYKTFQEIVPLLALSASLDFKKKISVNKQWNNLMEFEKFNGLSVLFFIVLNCTYLSFLVATLNSCRNFWQLRHFDTCSEDSERGKRMNKPVRSSTAETSGSKFREFKTLNSKNSVQKYLKLATIWLLSAFWDLIKKCTHSYSKSKSKLLTLW